MQMACPICKTIKDIVTLSERRQEPLFTEEQFVKFIPELLGFDTSDAAWHTPGKTRDQIGPVLRTHKFAQELSAPKKRRTTKAGNKRRKSMAKNLKIANGRGRKKNGDLKKGWSQKKIMATAHRLTKKECR